MSVSILKYIISFFLLSMIFMSHTLGQLDLAESSNRIQNTINFYMPAKDLINLKEARGEKLEFNHAKVKTDDGKNPVEKMRIRGQSSLSFDRKSFNIKLFFPHEFTWGEEKKQLKEFFLISLTMDENYYRSALSYKLLSGLGLFQPFFTFTEVRINNESQGVYLAIEKPHENAMKTHNSPCVIRRGYQHEISDLKFSKKKTNLKKSDFINAYNLLYELPDQFNGARLLAQWDKYLDTEAYFTWLAFNFYMVNGDYSDELYLCAEPEKNKVRFGILPWDYDDILIGKPHRKEEFVFTKGWEDKYMFMAEEDLDRVIGEDAFLHKTYLLQLEEVLKTLTDEELKASFEEIYRELSPFYRKKGLIGKSESDLKGKTNMKKFTEDFQAAFHYLVARREWMIKSME